MTSHRLLIAPLEEETGPREIRPAVVEDFRAEIRAAILETNLFAQVSVEPAARADLVLRPVLLIARETHLEDETPTVELAVRFELRHAVSRGVLWSREYRERSPTDLLARSPFPERRRLVASHAIRSRILEALRRDLTRFLLSY